MEASEKVDGSCQKESRGLEMAVVSAQHGERIGSSTVATAAVATVAFGASMPSSSAQLRQALRAVRGERRLGRREPRASWARAHGARCHLDPNQEGVVGMCFGCGFNMFQ